MYVLGGGQRISCQTSPALPPFSHLTKSRTRQKTANTVGKTRLSGLASTQICSPPTGFYCNRFEGVVLTDCQRSSAINSYRTFFEIIYGGRVITGFYSVRTFRSLRMFCQQLLTFPRCPAPPSAGNKKKIRLEFRRRQAILSPNVCCGVRRQLPAAAQRPLRDVGHSG